MNKNKILFSYNFDKYFYIYYLSCTFISLILKTVTMCDSVLWIGHKSQEGWISRMPVLHAWLASVCDGSYAWLALTWYPESRMRQNESMWVTGSPRFLDDRGQKSNQGHIAYAEFCKMVILFIYYSILQSTPSGAKRMGFFSLHISLQTNNFQRIVKRTLLNRFWKDLDW